MQSLCFLLGQAVVAVEIQRTRLPSRAQRHARDRHRIRHADTTGRMLSRRYLNRHTTLEVE